MIRASDLQNFINHDALKDWLLLYYDPTAERNQHPSNVANVVEWHSAPTELAYNVELCDDKYSVIVDIVGPTNLIKEKFGCTDSIPNNRLGCVFRTSTYNSDYVKLRAFMARMLLPQTEVVLCQLTNADGKEELRGCWFHQQSMQDLFSKAVQWYHLVRNEGQQWSIDDDYPPNVFMMPNCCAKPDVFSGVRERLAWRWADISLLYYVGAKTRERLHERGIYTLHHPKLIESLPSHPQKGIQMRMLSNMLQPIDAIDMEVVATSDDAKQYVYFDIENTLDEHNQILVNVVGLIYFVDGVYKYVSFVSDNDSCIAAAAHWLRTHVPNHTIVHYTAADCAGIPAGWTNTLDLYDVVRKQYFTSESLHALHLNSFKLKTIYEKLCVRLNLPNLYSSCDIKNGLICMQQMECWKQSNEEADESEIMQEVLRYNRVDCIALVLLHRYLNAGENKSINCSQAMYELFTQELEDFVGEE